MEVEKYFNQSIIRALDILEAVGKSGGSIRLSELSRIVGLHKSTVHRLVLSLESRGWLSRGEDGKYRIGIKFLTIAKSGDNEGSLKIIRPILANLSEKTQETAILSIWDGKEVICVDKVETSKKIQISSTIGSSFPIHAGGTGFAVLIGMPEDMALEALSCVELIEYTPHTIIDRKKLVENYRIMKELGYVITTGQVDPGVQAIAMPLYFPYEQCYASIGVVLPEMRADEETTEKIIRELQRCCEQIQSKLELFTKKARTFA
jgi:DNA-binding IclR family transcriptional regulator